MHIAASALLAFGLVIIDVNFRKRERGGWGVGWESARKNQSFSCRFDKVLAKGI